ncbi:gliding motility-associated C-terminal domain-containing protein [Flavobacterium sp.]|uniref:Ig-like domain-containing protein n=1 Tax=Flavobacterium sp. TaxID=239 RepID=UPI003C659B46
MKQNNLKKLLFLGVLLLLSNFSWSQEVKVELTFTYLNSVTKTFTVADLKVIDLPSGSSAAWYDVLTGGSALLSTTPLQTGKTYYLETSPKARIQTRLKTIVYEISPTISADKPNTVCTGDVVKISANNILSEEQFTAENTNGSGLNLTKVTQYGNSTYYIKPTAMTWEDANTLISSIPGASMYIVDSQAEETAVYSGLQSKGFTGNDNIALWLGLKQYEDAFSYSEAKDTYGGWYWINGARVTDSYMNWSAGEPNNYTPNPGVPPGWLLYQFSPTNIEAYAQFEFQNRGSQWNDAGNTNVHESYPIFEFTATTGLQWYKLNTTTNLYEIIPGETKGDLTITASAGSQKYRLDMLTNGITLPLFYEVIADAIPTTPTGNAIQNFCSTENPTVGNLQVVGTNVSWYSTEIGTTPLIASTALASGEYWAEAKSTNGCPSPARLKVTVNLTTTPTITSTTQVADCTPNSATLNAVASAGTINWYNAITGGNLIGTGTSITVSISASTDYYVDATLSGCTSVSRTKITAVPNSIPTITSTNDASTCGPGTVTLEANASTGTINWYDALTGGNLVGTGTSLVIPNLTATTTYYVDASLSSCTSSPRNMVTATYKDPAGLVTIPKPTMEFCPLKNIPVLNDLTVTTTTGSTINWYESETSITALAPTSELKTNETYWAGSINDISGCESTSRKAITVVFKCPEDIIYTGFSPNDDGVNDTYSTSYIKNLYPNFNIKIFNRWGRIVYKGDANTPEWNGENDGKGELVPVGVYYYLITFNIEGKKPAQGEIYLSR